MRRALTASSLLGALVASLLLLAPPGRAADAACPDCLRAGAARVAMAIPPGTPLGGYGDTARRLAVPDVLGRFPHAFWFRPNTGSLDPLAVRALVLESGGRRLTWFSVDLVAVDRALTARVTRALTEAGLPPGAVILSASHTHSGPGAFMESGFLGFVSVERFDHDVREALVDGLVQAARRAEATKVVAHVASASVTAPDVTISRLGQPVDRELSVMKFVSASGAPIAILWNYAIHGTMLGAFNLRLSADVMGGATRIVEQTTGVPALFVNGSVGDVSPARHGETEMESVGRELAAAVLGAATAAVPGPSTPLRIASTRVTLPRPRLSIRGCTSSLVPRWLTLPLGWTLPDDTELLAARLGDIAWVTMPGELQSRLGEAIKRSGRPAFARVLIAGLSNDYLGYFLTPADYGRVTYVACASLYGPDVGDRLARAAQALVRALATDTSRP